MSVRFSRRRLIVTGSAALVASAVEAKVPASPMSFSTADRELLAVSFGDARFEPSIATMYPGLLADPVFKKIAPLAMVITHLSGPGIRAYSVSWSVTTAKNTYTVPLFYYHAPGSLSKQKSLSTFGSARMDIIQPGDTVLVTPFFKWTPSFYKNNPNPDWKNLLSDVEPGDFLVAQLKSATTVNVTLDCAIFSDWKKMGPNQYHFARRLTARRNAEHDEGLAVYRMLRAGASDSVVIDTLTQHATAPRSYDPRPAKQRYYQCRRFQAQVLLRHFQDSDRALFTKALHRLVVQKRTDITKMIA